MTDIPFVVLVLTSFLEGNQSSQNLLLPPGGSVGDRPHQQQKHKPSPSQPHLSPNKNPA